MHVEYITVVALASVVTSVGTTVVLAARGRGPIGVTPPGTPEPDESQPVRVRDLITAGYGDPGES